VPFYPDGSVNPDETCRILREEFIENNNLEEVVGNCQSLVQEYIGTHTLIISCGEPIALQVASRLECKSIIVTDHFLTCTIRRVLENGGLLNGAIARLMTSFEEFDRLALEAFLSPVEFASPDYIDYLAQGGVPCIPISSLFYEPINQDILQKTPPYNDLKEKVKKMTPDGDETPPIVCVFGGGGSVWDEIYYALHTRA